MTENNKDNNKNIFVQFVEWCKYTFGKPITIFNIITLNLKILFNINSVELNKNRIQLLNEYFKINNYNRVIKLYEKMLLTFDFNNSDVQLLKNICSAYNNTKNFTKLLITIEKIFELKFLSKEDICYFRMYKGISFLALKQFDKYKREMNLIYDIDISDKEKYQIFITLTFVFIELKEYDEAFNILLKAIEFIPIQDEFLYKYYSVLSVVLFKKKENKIAKLSLKLRKLMENGNNLVFEQYYYIALSNFKIAERMQKNEIYNISVKYLQKAARLAQNNKQLTVCFILLQDCFSSMQKYYRAKGYAKLVIKYTNSKTLKVKYTQMLSAFYFKTNEFAKSLATSEKLLNHLDIFEESFVLASIAINQYKLNQFEEAEKNIKKAKLLNSNTKSIKDIINSYYEVIITKKKG